MTGLIAALAWALVAVQAEEPGAKLSFTRERFEALFPLPARVTAESGPGTLDDDLMQSVLTMISLLAAPRA